MPATLKVLSRTRFSILAGALLVAALLPGQASAQSLKVGDDAPPLKVGKWVKGNSVTKFDKGMVYVVEFWATWCGPCRQTIPHVSELQQKYKDKVVVIGANVWERQESQVGPFVEQMGTKMNYRVVLDDKSSGGKGSMAETWMEAAGRNGIPAAFVVDGRGKIAWIGHPVELEPALKKAIESSYDPAAGEKGKARNEANKKVAAAVRARDFDLALKELDALAAADSDAADEVATRKFRVLMQARRYDDAYAMGDALLEANNQDAKALNDLAWTLAADTSVGKRDFALAQKLATRAVELDERKTAVYLNTLARATFDAGDTDKGIEIQSEAFERADEKTKPAYKGTLERYKRTKNKPQAK